MPSATPASGVGASRWAAGVVRDFILRPDEDRLRLRLVSSPPIPFPPEPLRSLAVETVRRELDRADRNEGRRGLLLRDARRARDRLRQLAQRRPPATLPTDGRHSPVPAPTGRLQDRDGRPWRPRPHSARGRPACRPRAVHRRARGAASEIWTTPVRDRFEWWPARLQRRDEPRRHSGAIPRRRRSTTSCDVDDATRRASLRRSNAAPGPHGPRQTPSFCQLP